jgi:ribonuclease VapC
VNERAPVEKLKSVCEIEAPLLQRFAALVLIPFKVHDASLVSVSTLCNHILYPQSHGCVALPPCADLWLLVVALTASGELTSAANYLEAAIVVDANRNPLLGRRFDELVARTGIAIEPVDRGQAEIARAAYRDFGKGSGHPASLNFGDCFAYALARARREPLLFKGDDFSQTDVAVA